MTNPIRLPVTGTYHKLIIRAKFGGEINLKVS